MKVRTLEEIRDAARQLADQVNSSFVTDEEANFRINQRIGQLYDILIVADADRYVVEASLSSVSSPTPPWAVDVPEDFYQIRGIDLVRGRSRYPLETYQLQERNYFGQLDPGPGYFDRAAVRYRVAGNNIDGTDAQIHFDRNPGNATFALYYIPCAPDLANDVDELDGFNGWEDWVIFKVAADMLRKEESDDSAMQIECAQIENRIKLLATMRDSGSAPQVADVRSTNSWRPRVR